MGSLNTPQTVTVLDPQGVARTIPSNQLDDAVAAGGKQATKVIDPQGNQRWVPNENLDEAKSAGGTVVNPDGSFVVTPLEGEFFADTMKRAANAGKTVTPQVIQSQTRKGLKEAPVVLAAAPAMGAAGTTALAAGGEGLMKAPDVAEAVLNHLKQPGTIVKLPFGRAIEYYMLKELGFPKGTVSKIAELL